MPRARSQKRIEQNERVREDLFQAALKVVGELGYSRASIAKIAETAGVSTGTFYLHFASKEEIYDLLLPWANTKLVKAVPLQLKAGERYMEFEERNIRGFFNYANKDKSFARVMLEAEVAAPKAWAEYTRVRESAYLEVMEAAWDKGEFPEFHREELPVICSLMVGLRKALAWNQAGKAGVPRKAIETYLRFVAGALQSDRRGSRAAGASASAETRRRAAPVDA
jgi:AcrR family transcriptional regulator